MTKKFFDTQLAPFFSLVLLYSVSFAAKLSSRLIKLEQDLVQVTFGLVFGLWTDFWTFHNVDFQRVIYFRPNPSQLEQFRIFSAPIPGPLIL